MREAPLKCKGILAFEIHAFKQQCDCFVTNHILINTSDPKEVMKSFRRLKWNGGSPCKVSDPKNRTVNVKGNWKKALIEFGQGALRRSACYTVGAEVVARLFGLFTLKLSIQINCKKQSQSECHGANSLILTLITAICCKYSFNNGDVSSILVAKERPQVPRSA